jgi:hypothetical protein
MKKYMAILGLLMSVNSCNGQKDTMTTKTMLEEFNLRGKVKTITYEFERVEYSEKLYFDKTGMLVKQESRFNDINTMFNNYVYADSKLMSLDVFVNSNFLGQRFFEYDTLGLVISSDLNTGLKANYKYDELKNRIEYNGYLFIVRYKYNTAGQIIEEWEDEKLTKIFKHNKFGDVISITDVERGITETITLIYDDNGNWVERIAMTGYHYFTTEQIYTDISYYAQRHIRRIIEYYK